MLVEQTVGWNLGNRIDRYTNKADEIWYQRTRRRRLVGLRRRPELGHCVT